MLTLTASGSVSDYSDTSSLQQSVATAAGVDMSLVTINVAAASVIITATIAVPASTTAAALQASLSSKLATAATASAALGVALEAVPTVAVASPAASGDLTPEEGEAKSETSQSTGEPSCPCLTATSVGGYPTFTLAGVTTTYPNGARESTTQNPD